jgi:hypothetical protein
MKRRILVSVLLLLAAAATGARPEGFPDLSGPYLGQTPPVEGKALFAPGIVSTAAGNHGSAAISPDGREIYWGMNRKIWFTRLDDGRWTEPRVVPFCRDDPHLYGNPFVSPDGRRLFFTSFRPGAVSQEKENIWYAERTAAGWSEPVPVGDAVNALPLHWSISVSAAGTLYFQYQCTGDDCEGGIGDIYSSRLVDGAYAEPVRLGPEINTPGVETCPYVAPDGSYLVFNRIVPTDMTRTGIYISYHDAAGDWLPAIFVLGGSPDRGGISPRISPDGRYLFYANGSEGMWWEPAGFVEELRPDPARDD